MNWYLEVLKKYAVFSGRAQRAEYWYFILFNTIFICFFIILDEVVVSFSPTAGISLFSGIYIFLTIIPTMAVSVRRLHDTGNSGWWILIGVIPLIGFVLLVFTVRDSEPGQNLYGANPKADIDTKNSDPIHADTNVNEQKRLLGANYQDEYEVEFTKWSETEEQETDPDRPRGADNRGERANRSGQENQVAENSESFHDDTNVDEKEGLMDANLEDQLYETAWSELEENKMEKALWAKLFSKYGGDTNRAKAEYIRLRVKTLKKQAFERFREKASQKEQALKRRLDSKLMEDNDITYDGESYHYKEYKYAKLNEAVNSARSGKDILGVTKTCPQCGKANNYYGSNCINCGWNFLA